MTNVLKAFKADKLTFILGALLLLLLLTSMTFYLIHTPHELQRRFLFIREQTGELAGEIRPVSWSGGREEQIVKYLDELLLGPARMRLVSIFPPGTRINQVQLRGKTLYIDFSPELVFNNENHPLALVEIKHLIVDNLTMNFPRLEEIIITVNGLEPRLEIGSEA